MREPRARPSADVPSVVRALAETQRAVLSRRQLADAGIEPHHIRAQVRARRWRVVGLAVVLHRGTPDREQQRWIAVIQTRGRGALASFSALEAAGLRRWDRGEIHVVVARGWKVWRVPGLVVHESRRFDPARDIAKGPALPRTRLARAAIDGAAWSPSNRTAVGLLAAVVQQGLCSPAGVAAELGRAGRVRHVRVLREAVRDLEGGSQSLAEIEMAQLVREAGLGEPRKQVVRRDASGRRRYLDLEVDLPDGAVLMIEVEGLHHLDVDESWADQRRHNDLAGPRQVQLRFAAFAVRHERDEVLATLRRIRDAHSS